MKARASTLLRCTFFYFSEKKTYSEMLECEKQHDYMAAHKYRIVTVDSSVLCMPALLLGENTLVPTYAVKACRGNRSISPLYI